MFAPSSPSAPIPRAWWNDRRYAVALVLLCALPLLWPEIPPLTDLLGHMGRYHVQLNIDRSPYLSRYFEFRWALLGNLGVDLLVIPLSKLFGLPLAVKLIALAIPPATAAGLLLIAREVHGRIPPTAAFALPLVYSFPFQFGFVNYCLSIALALLAFALWLRLGGAGRHRLRAALFVAIGPVVWLAHVYGWAVLGLLCFAAELARDRGQGGTRLHALWRAALSTLPLAPPILLMLLWRGGAVAGMTGDWFNFTLKLLWIAEALRDRWMAFDVGSVMLLVALALIGLTGFPLRLDHMLATAALLLLIAFLCLPRILLGSAYADMRLFPYLLAVALIALKPAIENRRLGTGLAIAAALFFGARIGTTTWNFIGYDRAYARQLGALDKVERGARVLVLVNLACTASWVSTRMDHLGSQGIVRRDAFVNGQWVMPGAQLLTVKYGAAGRFATDPSQLLRPAECRGNREPVFEDTLAHFPRDAFDYFWLIDMPRERWPHDPGLTPIWSTERGVIYRVAHSATSASETPTGKLPRATQ